MTNDDASLRSSVFFHWKGVILEQQEQVLKIGTDALLLASWIPKVIPSANSVLDIGTGTGILALMAAKSFPNSKILAIDSDPEAFRLAKRNVDRSPFSDRIEVKETRFEELILEEKHMTDLIISNPPYFHHQVPRRNLIFDQKKHSILSPSVWMKGMRDFLSAKGHICLVLPADLTATWIKAANDVEIYLNHKVAVFSFRGDRYPKRCLLLFSHQLVKPNSSTLVIYEKEQEQTREFADFLGI